MAYSLLPSGLYDLLPPEARQHMSVVQRLLSAFDSWGYEQAIPPLMEFEDTLLAGKGQAYATQAFRVMDPMSQRMLGVRADMTMQIARIAATRLGAVPRPLRLAYAGTALRVRPEALQNARQFRQAGIELFGAHTPLADAEVIAASAEALRAIGVSDISIDINLPELLTTILDEHSKDPSARAQLKEAASAKDRSRLLAAKIPALGALLEACGPADAALKVLQAAALPKAGKQQVAWLAEVLEALAKALPNTPITLDPLETRGFEYHSRISFSVFLKGPMVEAARGGHYVTDAGEEATGATLYVDQILPHTPNLGEPQRVFLPRGTSWDVAAKLRAEGYAAVLALSPDDEANKLNCPLVWDGKKVSKR